MALPSASPSSAAPGSRLAIDEEMATALLSGIKGLRYDSDRVTALAESAERQSRFRDEATHAHARALRAAAENQQRDLATLGQHVSEMSGLIRERNEIERRDLEERRALGPDGLPRMSRWEAAGWGIPSPHAVYTFLFVVAEAVRESDFFPVGSLGARAAALAVAAFTLLGINAAKNHLSLQVRTKLRAFDAKALEDVHSLPPHKETP